MLKMKWTGCLCGGGGGGGWRQFGEEQTQCPCHADPFVRGGGQQSRRIWTHLINRAESVNFKENHPRVCYLYMELSRCGTMSSLSFLITVS